MCIEVGLPNLVWEVLGDMGAVAREELLFFLDSMRYHTVCPLKL